VIYDSPWVRLVQVDVESPSGQRYWHHVARFPRAALLVLIDGHGQVLMLWRHRFIPDRWGWELPGGLVEENEEPADAAVRELEEETGYRAGVVEPLATFRPMSGVADAEYFVFVGREPQRIGDPTDTDEAARLEWVPIASIPGLITSGEIWNAGSLVGLLRLLMKDGS